MLLGIGFITVITASITGAFVARSRREQPKAPMPAAAGDFERSTSASTHRGSSALKGLEA